MEIEVKQSNLVYVKAFVDNVSANGILVSYENGCKPSELVGYDRCRAVISEEKLVFSPSSVKIGDYIEALVKQPNDIFAWQKVKIRDVKVTYLNIILKIFLKDFLRIYAIILNIQQNLN